MFLGGPPPNPLGIYRIGPKAKYGVNGKRAARVRPTSFLDLTRRSGWFPPEPYPPDRHSYCSMPRDGCVVALWLRSAFDRALGRSVAVVREADRWV